MVKAKVQIKKLKKYGDNPEPCVAHDGDAGIDLRNCDKGTIKAIPGVVYKIPVGLSMAIPEGYAGIVFERSGLGAKYGVTIHGRVIDSGYRGEVCVLLTTQIPFEIKKGDRVAQIVFMPCLTKTATVKELDETKRGADGFGSTGKK